MDFLLCDSCLCVCVFIAFIWLSDVAQKPDVINAIHFLKLLAVGCWIIWIGLFCAAFGCIFVLFSKLFQKKKMKLLFHFKSFFIRKAKRIVIGLCVRSHNAHVSCSESYVQCPMASWWHL